MDHAEKMQALIDTLIIKTKERRIEWEEDESGDAFALSLTRGTVTVWSADGDGMHPFILRIRGDRGQIVEQVETARPYEEHTWSRMDLSIQHLHELARRNALNIDEVIDRIIEDLRER
ncbi:hypothetical protein ACFYUL_14955 [Streptomyces sp. NPDC004311]|uniref:hypothetical protein n=1 Tax=Streptomyces sp. NPDC004311 TaxID=3364698 RepID=UPI0036C5BF52